MQPVRIFSFMMHAEAAGVPGIMSSLFPPCILKILWLRFRAGPELNSTCRGQAGDCQFCQFCQVACVACFCCNRSPNPAQAPSDRPDKPDNPIVLPSLKTRIAVPGSGKQMSGLSGCMLDAFL